MKRRILILLALIVVAIGVVWFLATREHAEQSAASGYGPKPEIGAPRETLLPTMNVAKAVGWRSGEAPVATAGLKVAAYARGLDHPRWMLLLPNGDVLVAESNSPPRKGGGVTGMVMKALMNRGGAGVPSPNRIMLLRDADGDGVAESRSPLLGGLASALNSPFGMALVGPYLYVANTDAVVRFPFTPGETHITARPEKIVDLPGGANHWARNLIASPDGAKLYVTVGSSSNIAENGLDVEQGRAAIWEIDLASRDHRIFAYGLRNPNGLAWNPVSKALWTTVNERDMIGSDLVPDYMTSVQFGGFYGWPWYYWGGYIDKRVPEPEEDMQQYVIRPDYALGTHTASLGLAFADQVRLGGRFAEGAFIGQHGSWNRRPPSGYKVIFVPFRGGKPAGMPVDVLGGFLDGKEQARGRPVGVIGDKTGALLVADDVGNVIWRVSAG